MRSSPRTVIVSMAAVSTTNRNVSCGHGAQMPLAATVLPSETAWAIALRVTSRPRTSAVPYQDRRAPSCRNSGTETVAGTPVAASRTAARISSNSAAQYVSYFDAIPPASQDVTSHG